MATEPFVSPRTRELVLRTPRLAVTSCLVEDAAELQVVHSDPETMRYVRSGRPESRAAVAELVGRYRGEQAARGWTTWRLPRVGSWVAADSVASRSDAG